MFVFYLKKWSIDKTELEGVKYRPNNLIIFYVMSVNQEMDYK